MNLQRSNGPTRRSFFLHGAYWEHTSVSATSGSEGVVASHHREQCARFSQQAHEKTSVLKLRRAPARARQFLCLSQTNSTKNEMLCTQTTPTSPWTAPRCELHRPLRTNAAHKRNSNGWHESCQNMHTPLCEHITKTMGNNASNTSWSPPTTKPGKFTSTVSTEKNWH